MMVWRNVASLPLTLLTMNALSRREEDTLISSTKARALQQCDPLVKGGRGFLLQLIHEDTDKFRFQILRLVRGIEQFR